MDTIAVLIPCYNEEATVAKVVRDFRAALPQAAVYVYDNNSTDKTAALAEEAGAIVRRERRQGKGNVIRTMFRDVEAQCYILVDGDDTYPAEHAADMVRLVLEEEADMVVGDRLSSTYFSENKRAFHGVGNRLVRFLINRFFGCAIRDIMTGYRAFSRSFVKTFPIITKGFEIETEMTIHAVDKNFYIREVPVEYRDRPAGSDSKLNTFSDGFRVLKTIFGLYRDCRPMSFFGLLGIIFFLAALVFGIPVVVEFFQTGFVGRFPTLIVAAALLTCALLFLLVGIILQVLVRKHRQLFEILSNIIITQNKEKD